MIKKKLQHTNMYQGQVKEQWCKFSIISLRNKLSVIIISLSQLPQPIQYYL